MSAPTLHPLLLDWPAPAPKPVRLRVSGSAESSLRRGHPWLFAERIREQSREGAAGDLAVVFDRKRAFLAVGLLDPHSPIRLRVLRARTTGPIDGAFFAERLDAARARRAGLLATGTDGYRLVHGESDGLPGLVIDRYADTAVVKVYSHAWFAHLATVLELLLEREPFTHVVLRMARQLSDRPDLLGGLADGLTVWGQAPAGTHTFREHGLRYEVDPVHGQKTGFFLDQRDNRQRVRERARGLRVLNVCSYTGGFSLAAAAGGAREVLSLDLSGPALAAARRNVALNVERAEVAACRHDTLEGDAFERLAALADAGERYDVVVLDPPAFARRRAHLDKALSAYTRLTALGLGVLAQGGTLVTASCSSPVTPEAFRDAVDAAARRARRPLSALEETGHAVDHPTDFEESRYLKCLFARA